MLPFLYSVVHSNWSISLEKWKLNFCRMHLEILSNNDLFMVHYIPWICDKWDYFWNIKKRRNESTFSFGILRQWWNQLQLILESLSFLNSSRSQNHDFEIFTSIFRIKNMNFGVYLRSFTALCMNNSVSYFLRNEMFFSSH